MPPPSLFRQMFSCHNFNTKLKQAIRYRLIFRVSGKKAILPLCTALFTPKQSTIAKHTNVFIADRYYSNNKQLSTWFLVQFYHHYLLVGMMVGWAIFDEGYDVKIYVQFFKCRKIYIGFSEIPAASVLISHNFLSLLLFQ